MDFNQAQNAIQTPTSPFGSFPELQALYRSQFQLPVAQGQIAGKLGQDEFQLNQRKLQIKKEMEEIENAKDPAKYQMVKKEDGGFDFFDGAGKKITVKQYADAKGKRVADILKDSDNSSDIGFVRDYADMEDLMNAVYRGDRDGLAKIGKAHPGLISHIYGGYGIDKNAEGDWVFVDKPFKDGGKEVSQEEVTKKAKTKPEDILKPFREYYSQKFMVEPQGLRTRQANETIYPQPQPTAQAPTYRGNRPGLDFGDFYLGKQRGRG